MPTTTNGDVSLYYEVAGSGSETVVFIGDAGFGAWQWGWQHRAVAGPFRAVAFDHRGVGRSDAPAGPYSVSDLAGDVDAVLSDVGGSRAHLVGAGLGGVVALAVAHASGRVRSVTLLGSGFDGAVMDVFAPTDDENALRSSTERLLSAAFRTDQSEVVDRIVDWRAAEDAPRSTWAAHAAAVDSYDPPPLYEVTTPALVVHGSDDVHWPVEGADRLAEELPRGAFVGLDDARHLVGVERSRVVNDHLVAHVDTHSA